MANSQDPADVRPLCIRAFVNNLLVPMSSTSGEAATLYVGHYEAAFSGSVSSQMAALAKRQVFSLRRSNPERDRAQYPPPHVIDAALLLDPHPEGEAYMARLAKVLRHDGYVLAVPPAAEQGVRSGFFRKAGFFTPCGQLVLDDSGGSGPFYVLDLIPGSV